MSSPPPLIFEIHAFGEYVNNMHTDMYVIKVNDSKLEVKFALRGCLEATEGICICLFSRSHLKSENEFDLKSKSSIELFAMYRFVTALAHESI